MNSQTLKQRLEYCSTEYIKYKILRAYEKSPETESRQIASHFTGFEENLLDNDLETIREIGVNNFRMRH